MKNLFYGYQWRYVGPKLFSKKVIVSLHLHVKRGNSAVTSFGVHLHLVLRCTYTKSHPLNVNSCLIVSLFFFNLLVHRVTCIILICYNNYDVVPFSVIYCIKAVRVARSLNSHISCIYHPIHALLTHGFLLYIYAF